ncbi:MAG: 3-deoxy-8-phosphooctulonate synthase [Candidatus Omnitrophota bacterium]
MTKEILVKNIKIGGGSPLVLIAGPCVIEDKSSCLETARRLKKITQKLRIPFIFKSSFDKANRSSISSYRGPGLSKGLAVLKEIKEKLNIPILSDVHCREQVVAAAKVLDVIQIPAYLSRQTDLIIAVGKTQKVVNVKKGQFMAPWDISQTIKKIESTGNKKIIITERGVSFGYNNLVSDLRSLYVMRAFGYPVIYDATHSVQLPAQKGEFSSGERQYVLPLSRAAVAFGCDGLFLETHINPDKALCDGPNMIDLKDLERLLIQVKKIREIL